MLVIIRALASAIAYYAKKVLCNFNMVVTWITYCMMIFVYYVGSGCPSSLSYNFVINCLVITGMFVLIRVVAFCLKQVSPTVDGIPVPNERFTIVDEDSDMVSIDNDRLQEMLLYMADLEDTLERKGVL